MNQDQADFHAMLLEQDPGLGRWALGKLRDGKSPREVAYLLDYYARLAHGWSTGRGT